jgi:DNA adenine methylase
MSTIQLNLFNIKTAGISPKPFLKWAGGKSQLLNEFRKYFPKEFNNYYEPFVGSGAVYWEIFKLREEGYLNFKNAKISDNNYELINCYIIVRDFVEELIEQLRIHKKEHSKEYYYKIRAQKEHELDEIQRAARFIYLNKTCFNGLYRVNRNGEFNVPMGSYKNPQIFNVADLVSASIALKHVDIENANYRDVLKWAEKEDFIYFDPPYAPISTTANFTGYTAAPFSITEQVDLAKMFTELNNRGCKLMLSNSWLPLTLNLYKGFKQIELKAIRAINSNPQKRGKISELLVLSDNL